ncbi:hypothetical protein C4D60_Mb08t01520 [Musa balbisiana]|uniref:Homeobox domain-containing protein n=1 Tax=Musa balbisiana TaxID=52838 RepID=A0A4S8K0J1_MUSBA|nr:hypothetical protein C4D60_Mb08t01520 [Musa balbisiana]
MDDRNQCHNNSPNLRRSVPDGTVTEPVRTRWTPKPEQILILESIFNSGMVTLQRQNRRSRSRRRQRQLQASLMAGQQVSSGVPRASTPPTSSSTSSSNSAGGGAGLLSCSSFASSSSLLQPEATSAMDDRNQCHNNSPNLRRSVPDGTVTEPVRTRWTPKPEQILILESIFNSGMVNPPKGETVRIRKLLEQFGSVGDANVFYWFQNRRSRSRRRQRQLQASLMAGQQVSKATSAMDDRNQCHNNSPNLRRSVPDGTVTEPVRTRWTPKPEQILILESIFNSGMVNPPKGETVRIRKLLEQFGSVGDANVFYWFQNRRSRSRRRQRQLQASLMAGQQVSSGVPRASTPPTSSSTSSSNSAGEPGTVIVFINGDLNEVPSGPIDLRAMFGHNVMLVHSSGEVLPVNEHGILMQSLQMGESYEAYLVNTRKTEANSRITAWNHSADEHILYGQ